MILWWFDEDSETLKRRLTTWQGRQAQKVIMHQDLMDILRTMGLGAENDWVYLVMSHRKDGEGFAEKKRSCETKGGVLEEVLGWLSWSCWVHSSYCPVGLERMLAGLCWERQS